MANCLVEKLKDSIDNPNLPVFEPVLPLVYSIENGFISFTHGAFVANSNFKCTSFIPIDKNHTYKFTSVGAYNETYDVGSFCFYKSTVESYQNLVQSIRVSGNVIITPSDIPEGANYIRVNIGNINTFSANEVVTL